MKKQNWKVALGAVCLMLCAAACQDQNGQDVLNTETQPEEGAPVSDVLLHQPQLIAKIQKDGHQVRFIAVGEEVDMIEKLPGTSASSLLELHGDKTPFGVFTALTTEDVHVPALIAGTAKGNELSLSNRNIDNANALVEIQDGSFNEVSTEACTNISPADFMAGACEAPVISNANNIEFCDNGSWLSLTRQSSFGGQLRAVKKVLTRTNVICGLTRIKFRYWDGSVWQLYHQVDFTDGYWVWKRHSGTARYRRVERVRPNSTGSFRAFTRFHQ